MDEERHSAEGVRLHAPAFGPASFASPYRYSDICGFDRCLAGA